MVVSDGSRIVGEGGRGRGGHLESHRDLDERAFAVVFVHLQGAVFLFLAHILLDLEAECEFDGFTAKLPRLLEALRRGQNYVQLDDGSRGLLPQEWLAKFAPLAGLGVSAFLTNLERRAATTHTIMLRT